MKNLTIINKIVQHKWHYAFITPMLIMFTLFTFVPVINIVRYSFYEWDGFGPLQNYIRFENYFKTVTDPYYWNAFRNSLIFAFSHLVFEVGLSLILAVILNNLSSRARNVYRLLIFIPVITTTSVVGMVFAIILSPMGGTVNETLRQLGLIITPINFLGSKQLALPTVIMVSIWKRIGISLIYWLAALQTISPELYESSDIDGASSIQKFIHITVPMLVPIGAVIALFAFKNGLYPFDLVKTMTAGGPMFSTDVLDTYIYRYAFSSEFSVPRYGFASAAGIIFSVSIIVITFMVTFILKGRSTKEIRR